ncbi:amidohydrolase [Pelagirhabdus alkalitolerans]|uniref:Amidohydrolase n=1 Tax=Pelagirhabdus alkalitolerans TaxID=1612202 RepID=A0A1G6LMD0_9BACI|nr:amidohydrolase [Pelagirhabdus alkalitolerans]SDC44304.1 amidohydrolase [Pelagirhabdus alkalitolerans]
MWEQLINDVDQHFEQLVETRRYLHQHPELSFKEYDTANYIASFYDQLDIPYQTNVGGNGVIARIKGHKPGKTIAFRADFDALPIHDQKTVDYRSQTEGVMHACGHDGHTSILLTFAKLLKSIEHELAGEIVLVHQHAEELPPGGAKSIIDSGALEDVDYVFGTHLWSGTPLGVVETAPEEFMAGADKFHVTIQGKGGHGAMPHETKDAVIIGAQLVDQLQQIVSRRLNPLDTAVVTIGKFQAGDTFNIIADQAQLSGTVRTFDPSVQDKIIDEMNAIISGVCTGYDVSFHLDYEKGYPPVVNHRAEAARALEAAEHIQEVKKAQWVKPSMTAEDFSYYLLEKPGAFFFTGAQIEDQFYPHHHPKFDFDERAMLIAVKTFLQITKSYQSK